MIPVLYKLYPNALVWYFGFSDGIVKEMSGRKYMACYTTEDTDFLMPLYSPVVVKFEEFDTQDVESNVKKNLVV